MTGMCNVCVGILLGRRRHSEAPGGQGGASRDLQRQAWQWALAHRAEDGSLPSGREIARQYGRHERWGRLVKRSGVAGELASGSEGGQSGLRLVEQHPLSSAANDSKVQHPLPMPTGPGRFSRGTPVPRRPGAASPEPTRGRGRVADPLAALLPSASRSFCPSGWYLDCTANLARWSRAGRWPRE